MVKVFLGRIIYGDDCQNPLPEKRWQYAKEWLRKKKG